MPASPVRPADGRVHLGSPVVPINPPASYLRHRAAVARAYRLRRRAIWRRRMLLAVVCSLLYLAIGRELIALLRAKKDTMAMEIRHDAHTLANDIERIADVSGAQAAYGTGSPVAFTSAAALARREDPDDIDAWLSDDPVGFQSRVE